MFLFPLHPPKLSVTDSRNFLVRKSSMDSKLLIVAELPNFLSPNRQIPSLQLCRRIPSSSRTFQHSNNGDRSLCLRHCFSAAAFNNNTTVMSTSNPVCIIFFFYFYCFSFLALFFAWLIYWILFVLNWLNFDILCC